MGKKKQAKLYQLNKEKSKEHKEEMKAIMKALAEKKVQNEGKSSELTPITSINLKKKTIKKEHKQQKHKKGLIKQQQSKMLSGDVEDGGSKMEMEQSEQPGQNQIAAKPKINIFATNEYDSGVKTQINTPTVNDSKVDESTMLEHKARAIMGENFTVEQFGDKPLKVIEEAEKVEYDDDHDQPNSAKNISHPDIKIPDGSFMPKRKAAISEFRKSLPIAMKEQEVIETINNHLVTLVCGETGSGKSTQLPQFLVEKNYHTMGRIAVTQPRKLATISLASRVSQELNCGSLGDFVGYQVRHDRKDTPGTTAIKFMTDGILLNEMNSDFLLQEYSCIVIDEAHERKVNTDILIGLLSRTVLLRYRLSLKNECQPLRIVIMSATMRIDDFNNKTLFDFYVPILKVEARMYPVTMFYEKRTPESYIKAAVNKCLRIHRTLPDGDVLVFLTGKEQIHEMNIMLEQEFEREKFEQQEMKEMQQEQELDHHRDTNQKISENPLIETQNNSSSKPYMIFELYSSLPLQDQKKIFLAQAPGTRKFVISTNIAETSITIPNIRYVIDSGQEKHRYFDKVWKWRKGWGSKAMAEQRTGRAGRTAHGYCYRLYSAALYSNIMDKFPPPQILKQPLDSTVLQLKSIGIQNVYAFPFPTMPEVNKIEETLEKLINLKALTAGAHSQQIDKNQSKVDFTKITKLGEVLSFIPLDPKLGKMLLLGRERKVEKYVIFIVILLTVEHIYQEERMSKAFEQEKEEEVLNSNLKDKYLAELRAKNASFKNKFSAYLGDQKNGDIFTAINVLGEFFTRIYRTISQKKKGHFNIERQILNECKMMSLNSNTMREVYYNTDQICEIYETLCSQKLQLSSYTRPNSQQVEIILDILLQTFIEKTCRHQEKNRYVNREEMSVYIHNLSPLYMKSNLFVGCVDYYKTQFGRIYMKYPFLVRNYEILAQFGQVKEEQDYKWKDNRIVGRTTGVIYGWQVPNLYVFDPKDKTNKWVALVRMLLEGQIFPELKTLKKFFKGSMSTIKVDNLDYRLQKIVEKLRLLKVESKEQFLYWFRTDKRFLMKELELFYTMAKFQSAYEKVRATIVNGNPMESQMKNQ